MKASSDDFKRADEKLKEEIIREFLKEHSIYVIEAVGFATTEERKDELKEKLSEMGLLVHVYRKLV